jgi:hypothetical protein
MQACRLFKETVYEWQLRQSLVFLPNRQWSCLEFVLRVFCPEWLDVGTVCADVINGVRESLVFELVTAL